MKSPLACLGDLNLRGGGLERHRTRQTINNRNYRIDVGIVIEMRE